MRLSAKMTRSLSALLLSLCAAQAPAQDFIGFDRESFGSVVLNRKQAAGAGNDISLELAVGDYNNESITNYSRESIFAKMGLSVGRLDILTDKGVFPCTAFIVDEKHILTNHHCVPGILQNERAGATRIDSVMFVAGYTQQGVEEGTKRYTVIPTPIETSEDLDYSVLEVIGNPSMDFGTLRLAANVPHDSDPYWVIGHPMGEAQRISREKCRANQPALSNHRLLHTCDTLPGNSGSPVIDASSQMVVGLHHAGSNRDAVNFAIPMAEILGQSRVLKAASGNQSGTSVTIETTGNDRALCDALYAEAKTFGECFAYEAYIQACDSHPYAILAKGFVARECTPVDISTNTGAQTGGELPLPNDGYTGTPEHQSNQLLRTWCGAARLNATEAAICRDPYLASLDGELEDAYARPARSVSATDQSRWRTGTRDRCGAEASCIASAVIARISYLRSPAAPSNGNSGSGTVRGNYELSGSCYIVTASRPNEGAAKGFISSWFGNGSNARMFRASNGYYAVVLETVSKDSADWRLNQLKSQGKIPTDSYCSTGSRFTDEVLWNGGSGGGSPSGYTMYIDNTSSLNVRSGPGTEYGRITALDRGAQVTVIGQRDDWANIRSSNGQTGWVSAKYLSRAKPTTQRQCYASVVNIAPYNSRTRSDGSGYLNVRSQPTTKSPIVTETYLGDTLRVYSQSNGWSQVSCVAGQCQSPYRGSAGATGWASSKYLAIRCN